VDQHPARPSIESVRFERSPAARFGTQAVLLVVAIPLALKASGMAAHGAGTILAFVVVGAALAAPVALDLWAMVAADREGIRWRNRLLVHRLRWDAVAGFAHEPTGTVLRRTDGRDVPLNALGKRYLGSKKLAAQRLQILDDLRRAAA
jgi:Bacterial PH domain